MKSRVGNYKNISLGYVGPGCVFGVIDVVKKRNYLYTFRAAKAGATLYLLKASAFN
jgi:CRP-like cAMP-binding protein